MTMLWKPVAPFVAKHLRHPRKGPVGYIIMNKLFPKKNQYLEENAVKLCGIEPHHTVLEVGFGPGLGLEAALKHIEVQKGGSLHGIDVSRYSLETAQRRLEKDIAYGKLTLLQSDVQLMAYEDNKFDRIFHTNCFYFWPDMRSACAELYRVIKPHSLMVTCMNMESIHRAMQRGFLQNANPDPVCYMAMLEEVGFSTVKMEYMTDEKTKTEFSAILAQTEEKSLNEEVDEQARQELAMQQGFL